MSIVQEEQDSRKFYFDERFKGKLLKYNARKEYGSVEDEMIHEAFDYPKVLTSSCNKVFIVANNDIVLSTGKCVSFPNRASSNLNGKIEIQVLFNGKLGYVLPQFFDEIKT